MAYKDIQPAGNQLPYDEDFKLEFLLPPVLSDQQVPTNLSELDANTGLSAEDIALKEKHQANSDVNVWVALARELQRTMQEFAGDRIESMANSRKIGDDDSSEPYDIANMARMMGFVLPDDVMQRTLQSNIKPLMPLLGRYSDTNHNKRWSDFLAVLLGGKVQVQYLYTKDYIDFVVTPGGPLLQEGGDWWRTTHINIRINYAGYTDTVSGGGFSTSKGRQIIEEYMPINLVIHRFGFYLRTDIQAGIAVAGIQPTNFKVKAQLGKHLLTDRIAHASAPVIAKF